jgi:hypothetical protein
MKKKILLVVGLILLMSLTTVFAASRHTKEEAPVRLAVTIAEGQTWTKTISSYDPDGDTLALTVEDLPTGATLAAQVTQPTGYTDPALPPVPADAPNAVWYTRDVSWTPNYQQSGTYTMFIHAVDSNGDDDWVKYVITVTNTNRPPVL